MITIFGEMHDSAFYSDACEFRKRLEVFEYLGKQMGRSIDQEIYETFEGYCSEAEQLKNKFNEVKLEYISKSKPDYLLVDGIGGIGQLIRHYNYNMPFYSAALSMGIKICGIDMARGKVKKAMEENKWAVLRNECENKWVDFIKKRENKDFFVICGLNHVNGLVEKLAGRETDTKLEEKDKRMANHTEELSNLMSRFSAFWDRAEAKCGATNGVYLFF